MMSAPASPVPDEPEKAVFGIDLGTLRSRVLIVKQDEDGLCKSILFEDIPSVVTFTKHDASKCIVGSAAKIRIIASASNTFCVTKYLIGRNYEDPVVQEVAEKKVDYKIIKSFDGRPCMMSSNCNQVFTPNHIAALILLKLKELGEDEVKIPVKNVVIATPAYFTEIQVQATREAAQMAGLNVLKIINEPIAAVLGNGANQTDKTVVVYDFGGTFKVSVVEIRNGEPEVKSTVHDLFLGGDDFDNVLVNYFVEELKRITKFDCSKDINTMQWLKKAAEDAKIDLSSLTEIKINFYTLHPKQSPQRITLWLKRSEFEELVKEFINKTIPLCHEALKDANVSVSDIDEVFAIGGISMMPKVKSTMEEIFGKAPCTTKYSNRKGVVAFGAALTGYFLGADLTTDDDIVPVEVFPHLPKPVKETDEFKYNIADDDSLKYYHDLLENARSSGIFGILTDKEADNVILSHHTDREDGEDDDEDEDVSYITANKKFLRVRRRDTDKPMSEELKKVSDFFRRGRDDIILEGLRRVYSAIL